MEIPSPATPLAALRSTRAGACNDAGSTCQFLDVPRFFRGRPPALTGPTCRIRATSTPGSPGAGRNTATGSGPATPRLGLALAGPILAKTN
jgi:hypothetical protein